MNLEVHLPQIPNQKSKEIKNKSTIVNIRWSKKGVLYILEEQKHNDMVESVIINENVFYFFMCSPRQIENVVHFCCHDTETGIYDLIRSMDNRFLL